MNVERGRQRFKVRDFEGGRRRRRKEGENLVRESRREKERGVGERLLYACWVMCFFISRSKGVGVEGSECVNPNPIFSYDYL